MDIYNKSGSRLYGLTEKEESAVEWGTAFTIALLWIALTVAVYAIIALFDRRFRFVNHEGFADLGRFFMRILITVVPAILFLAINLLVRVGGKLGIRFVIPVLLLEILLVPGIAFVKMHMLNPERLAKKARSAKGDFETFRKEYLSEHRGGNERTPSEVYVWEQFCMIADWQGNSYRFCPKKRRLRFANAVFELNRDVMPDLSEWEWHERESDETETDTIYVLKYNDGTQVTNRIYRDYLLTVLWTVLLGLLGLKRRRK